jgi:hypothetical protein
MFEPLYMLRGPNVSPNKALARLYLLGQEAALPEDVLTGLSVQSEPALLQAVGVESKLVQERKRRGEVEGLRHFVLLSLDGPCQAGLLSHGLRRKLILWDELRCLTRLALVEDLSQEHRHQAWGGDELRVPRAN